MLSGLVNFQCNVNVNGFIQRMGDNRGSYRRSRQTMLEHGSARVEKM